MLLASSASSSGNSNFLIPNGTFIAELVMFIIVLGIVAKFILPPLQRAMDERDSTIRRALEQSDEGHVEAGRLDGERRSTLEAAHAEARSIIEAATKEAEQLREQARARGEVELDRLVTAAQSAITGERAQLREETLSRLASIVIDAAERIVGADVDPERHRDAITDAIAEANAASNADRDTGSAT